MFGGCIYNMDSRLGVIHMLVFPVCWDVENTHTHTHKHIYIYIYIYIYCAFVGLDNKIYQYYFSCMDRTLHMTAQTLSKPSIFYN
jgi:hypothetical protein